MHDFKQAIALGPLTRTIPRAAPPAAVPIAAIVSAKSGIIRVVLTLAGIVPMPWT